MKIGIITIGDELLLGQVIDSNSAKIANMIYPLGLKIEKKWCISDQHEAILSCMAQAEAELDLILVTGGLGPTRDDITKKTMAEFFGVPLVFSDENYQHILSLFNARNIPVREEQKSQCFIPEGTRLLENKMGTAMGLYFHHQHKHWFAMPGVPFEMEYIMQNSVLPFLQQQGSHERIMHKTIHIAGLGETDIASRLEPLLHNIPQEMTLAYLPSIGLVKFRLTMKSENEQWMSEQLDHYINVCKNELGDKVFSASDENLESVVANLLNEKNFTLGLCESCTGGFLSYRFTTMPGASDYFKGTIVCYSNEIKMNLLKVQESTLDQFGAVSEETVKELVIGGIKTLNVDCCISISGIAGPSGGTIEKPVGTIWIAVGNAENQLTKKLLLWKDRKRNIEGASTYALILCREWLLKQTQKLIN